jgi:hypothetical protein
MDPVNPLPKSEPAPTEEPSDASPPLKKVRIDREEFVFAMEGGMSEMSRWFLDTQTGEVFPLMEEQDDYDELCDQIDAAEVGRYLEIDRIESHEGFEVMEDFAASIRQPRTRERLLEALARKKPFRRFKDAVDSDPHLRERWFAFRDEAYAELANDWLEANGIDPEWIPRGGGI